MRKDGDSMESKIAAFSTTKGMTRRCREVFVRQGCPEIPIYEMTMDSALAQAEKCIHDGTLVLICRGGTAEFLRKCIEVPIIDIRHSFLSVFLSVKELRKQYRTIAIVAFGLACDAVRKYNSIMNDDVRVLEVTSSEEFESSFEDAVRSGAEVVLGGIQVEALCRERGFPYFSMEPDDSEIGQALEEAFYSLRIEEERNQQYSLITTILNCATEGIVGIDGTGTVFHINQVARRLLHYTERCRIDDLMPAEKVLRTLETGEDYPSELVTVRGKGLVCGCRAIRSGDAVSGAVLTLQEASAISTMDGQIRKKLLGRGHVAKKEFVDLVGHSTAILQAVKTAQRYARSGSSLLILGETGTGKEVFAQSIHNSSSRRKEPFVAVNCAALPPNILESELFGYVHGAFTGARTEGKPGIFELAHKGTVFLDEISEMSTDLQVKLLRVLQEREVTRIGDDRVIPVDVRVLAASNIDIQGAIAQGRFRMDLYYRIGVLELYLPPLRERREDIPDLAESFMRGHKSLTARAEEALKAYPWPGNIRQLSNVMERLDVLCDHSVITHEDVLKVLDVSPGAPGIPERPASADAGSAADEALLPRMEERLIQEVLSQVGGNKALAASRLGMSKTTLWRRLKAIRGANEQGAGYQAD